MSNEDNKRWVEQTWSKHPSGHWPIQPVKRLAETIAVASTTFPYWMGYWA